VQAGKLTAEAMQAGRKLMVCGNGGSAADSQHLVAEFVSRLTIDCPAQLANALTPLPASLVGANVRLSERCAIRLGADFSSFLVVGRGGTFATPDEPQQ